jgi:hypothetical protein
LEKSATEKGKNIMHIKKKFNKVYENNIKINLADNNNVILFNRNYDIDNSKNLSLSPFTSDKNMRANVYNKKNSLNNIDIIKEQTSINNKINIQKKCEGKSKEYKEKRIPHKSFDANALPFDIMNKNEDKDIFKFKALLKKFFNYKKKKFLYEKMAADNINNLFTLGNYLASLLFYKKPRNYYLILEKFRKKLLSEEHFFRTHNFLYLFEKSFDLQETKKIDIIELYKNL